MLAGGTGVAVVKVSAMRPSVVVVEFFFRRPGRGGFAIAASLIAVVVGLPGLLVDCLLDDFKQRFGINSAACKRLGINSDFFIDFFWGGGGCLISLSRMELQVVCGEGRHLLLHCHKVGLVFKEEGLAFNVGWGKVGYISSRTRVVDADMNKCSLFIVQGLYSVGKERA